MPRRVVSICRPGEALGIMHANPRLSHVERHQQSFPFRDFCVCTSTVAVSAYWSKILSRIYSRTLISGPPRFECILSPTHQVFFLYIQPLGFVSLVTSFLRWEYVFLNNTSQQDPELTRHFAVISLASLPFPILGQVFDAVSNLKCLEKRPLKEV